MSRKISEFELIDSVRRRVGASAGVRVGIGDDCAVLASAFGAGELLVTTDMLMDGRHFTLSSASPREVGRKAMGVNLSDIAAMAGKPVAAFVSVALPRDRAAELAEELLDGILEMAREYDVALAGGDTNAWAGPLVVSVTIVGVAGQRGPILRSGAKIGDRILVTGRLGGSLSGRHLDPRPRIAEAQRIVEREPIHAMIDLSDGLASDLGHIVKESRVPGAILDAAAIPIHADALRASKLDGVSALEHALGDGEDFELCFTTDAQSASRLLANPPEGVVLSLIGSISDSSGILIKGESGELVPISARGFDHFLDDPGGAQP